MTRSVQPRWRGGPFSDCPARLARVAVLAAGVTASVAPAHAQGFSAETLARAASLFERVVAACAPHFNVDEAAAQRAATSLIDLGKRSFGAARFDEQLAREALRRGEEINTQGAERWCAGQWRRRVDPAIGKMIEDALRQPKR